MAKPDNTGTSRVGIVQTATYIRVREEAALTAPEIAQIVAGSIATFYPDTECRVDGWDWVYGSFEIPDGRVFDGWMARVWPLWSEQFAPVLANGDFFLVNPCDFPFVITGRFNDSRKYPANPTKLQKHEGLDFAPASGTQGPWRVVAAQAGIVTKVGNNPAGYGDYVRIEHAWGETETYVTWYGHLEPGTILVKEGDSVHIGQHIGNAGTSGNSSGVHLHLTLQHIGHGLDNYVVDDVVSPDAFFSTLPDYLPPPPIPDEPPPVVTPIVTIPPALHGLMTADEAQQLATLFSQASALFSTIAGRMRGE